MPHEGDLTDELLAQRDALAAAATALLACVDSIDAPGPKGGMWGQNFGYKLRAARERCWAAFS